MLHVDILNNLAFRVRSMPSYKLYYKSILVNTFYRFTKREVHVTQGSLEQELHKKSTHMCSIRLGYW